MASLMRRIWGRDYTLEVHFEDLDGEGVSAEQKAAYENFVSQEHIVDDSLPYVIDYCLAHNADEIGEDGIDNIFRYVVPAYVFIPRYTGRRDVALMCDYRFDLEHGLAILFSDGVLREIGSQDIVL